MMLFPTCNVSNTLREGNTAAVAERSQSVGSLKRGFSGSGLEHVPGRSSALIVKCTSYLVIDLVKLVLYEMRYGGIPLWSYLW